MSPYSSTSNKAAIRLQWDLPILDGWQRRIGRSLTYLGLPGPEIHDFRDWTSVLDPRRTGVEEIGHTADEQLSANEAAGQMLLNVAAYGMDSGYQQLRGLIENIILDGVDVYGMPPQLNDGAPEVRRHFSYDFVNLDFDGGFGYPSKRDRSGAANRINGIKKLFERQQGHDFVLFLTINVRDRLDDRIDGFLAGLESLKRGTGWPELVQWYRERGSGQREYKLKATVPSFIHSVAQDCEYRVECHPPVAYEGHNQARMIHFAFELESSPRSLRGFSAQDDPDLLQLPLIRVADGRLAFADVQHPGFDRGAPQPSLQFLPDRIRREILTGRAAPAA